MTTSLVLFVFAAIMAGVVQGITGFGAGIILMLVLPSLFALPQAAGLAGAIALAMMIMMVLRYRNHINKSLLIRPAILFMLASSLAITMSTRIDQYYLKIAFAIFLIVLAIYFLTVKNTVKIKTNFATLFVVSVISGLCDGFFGIGGPLMVIFFLATTHSKEEYLATIQSFFAMTAFYALIFRTLSGIFNTSMIGFGLLGIVAILIGLQLGNYFVDKIDHELVKKLTYLLIGASGVITLLTTIF